MNAIEIELSDAFIKQFGQKPLLVKSPGRVNIIGEHTDYNEGFVLPAAIGKAAYVAISLRTDDVIHLVATDMQATYIGSITQLEPIEDGSWTNFIIGVVVQFVKQGIAVTGFNAILSSDVPIGAGLSSSAAIECATVFALNELFQTKLDRLTMVKMAQKAEHEYAGVMCGIMDQFASMMGKKDHVIKLDCRTLEYEYVPIKLEGIKVLLLNTNVKHSLASSEYNTRRNECSQAVAWVKEYEPTVNSLRDVTEAMLNKYVLPKDSLIDKRSRFVVQEINRLVIACNDLKNGNLYALGKKMYATHEGLSSMYAVSCKELDWLVDYVKTNKAVIGARMMGGGFGGCTINLIKEEAIEPLITTLQKNYEAAMGLPLTYYVASIEDGTKIVNG